MGVMVYGCVGVWEYGSEPFINVFNHFLRLHHLSEFLIIVTT